MKQNNTKIFEIIFKNVWLPEPKKLGIYIWESLKGSRIQKFHNFRHYIHWNALKQVKLGFFLNFFLQIIHFLMIIQLLFVHPILFIIFMNHLI